MERVGASLDLGRTLGALSYAQLTLYAAQMSFDNLLACYLVGSYGPADIQLFYFDDNHHTRFSVGPVLLPCCCFVVVVVFLSPGVAQSAT